MEELVRVRAEDRAVEWMLEVVVDGDGDGDEVISGKGWYVSAERRYPKSFPDRLPFSFAFFRSSDTRPGFTVSSVAANSGKGFVFLFELVETDDDR